jgi:hypothetical protein
MSFFKFLEGIGDRLGILESVSTPESKPATRIQTRSVSLQELASEIRSGEVRTLADSPAELSIPFEEIFAAAGISSKPEDWTIDRLKQLIASEAGKQKSRDAVQKAVLEHLGSESVHAETLVKDAIARDQALDAFESRVNEKMRDRNQACKRRLLELETQIKELREESAKIEAGLKADDGKWSEWKRRKREYERELAAAAGFIVDRPVVTMDEEE